MLVLSLVIAVALFAFLVQHSDEIKTELNKQAASNSMQQTFSAGTFHVQAPNSFSDSRDDNPDAAVSIGNDATNVYLLAYSDNASDIADGTTLTQYADNAFDAFTRDTSFSGQKREQLAPGTVSNPNNLEVIDYKMEASYGINKYVYYDRYIKTTDGFYMLTTWTNPGRLDANLPTMKAILASFEETTSPSR
jgi:hypothetical protein